MASLDFRAAFDIGMVVGVGHLAFGIWHLALHVDYFSLGRYQYWITSIVPYSSKDLRISNSSTPSKVG